MPKRLLSKLARKILPLPKEDEEAKHIQEWEAWKMSMSCKDKWLVMHCAEGCIVDCPVESLIYPQGECFRDMDNALYLAPWNRKTVHWGGIFSKHLQRIISDEYHNSESPAKKDAESFGMDEKEYGYYMGFEYYRARDLGRRSRLDDVCESHGGKVEDYYDWDSLAARGLEYDDSWGREHPSMYAFKQGKGLKFFFM
ncbi:MAG: hypothetical protein Q9178_005734 [Gyalolechia marmorata]